VSTVCLKSLRIALRQSDKVYDKDTAFNNPKVTFLPTVDLVPDPRNPKIHDRAQICAIAKSIESFGFNAPILVSGDFLLRIVENRDF
jgi:hypothetical protein